MFHILYKSKINRLWQKWLRKNARKIFETTGLWLSSVSEITGSELFLVGETTGSGLFFGYKTTGSGRFYPLKTTGSWLFWSIQKSNCPAPYCHKFWQIPNFLFDVILLVYLHETTDFTFYLLWNFLVSYIITWVFNSQAFKQ